VSTADASAPNGSDAVDRAVDNPVDDLIARFGSAKHPDRPVARTRPDGASDATVAALGKLSEALELVERCRGLLYDFHRHSGTVDFTLQDAVTQLREAGWSQLADEVDEVLVGRDVIEGMWTFQVVEAYDRNYWDVFRAVEEYARASTGVVQRHVHEAEMKHREQSGRVK
jgi:hypothetical protein